MPLNKYFKGKGKQVMDSMQGEYGNKKGKSVFYATANKKGMKPKNTDSEVKLLNPSRKSKKPKFFTA